jgi:hypothetical protein
MEKKIIKIQRFYRISKLSQYFDNLEKYNLTKKNIDFNDFTKKIKDNKLINNINKILYFLNKLSCKSFKINPRIILSAFLINNYCNDVIGPIKDRHPIDHLIIDWSQKLVSIFKKEKNYYKYNLLIIYLNNYIDIFNNWKNVDKNRTIQNLIISYGNRMDHLEYIYNEELEEEAKNKMINMLNKECDSLLQSIIIIDKDFDINSLKQNYKKIISDIKESMEKIFNNLTLNFKNAYLNMLISEFENDNNNIIINLINETNQRILLLTPKKYINSIKNKFLTFNFINNLLEENYSNLNEYFYFLIDTICAYSAPEDNDEIVLWKNKMLNWLNCDADIDYKKIIPSLLLEINTKIDILIYKINNII